MLAFILCLGLFIVLMSIRSRLDKAEREERKLATTLATLAAELANQAAEPRALQTRFDALRSGEPVPVVQEPAWVEPLMAEPATSPKAASARHAALAAPPQAAIDPAPLQAALQPPASLAEVHDTSAPVSEVWFERSGRDPVARTLEPPAAAHESAQPPSAPEPGPTPSAAGSDP
jgi:hypothetical protein